MKKYTIIAIATVALLVAGTAKTIANEQPAIETEQQDDRVYDICEQLPHFPGGEAKLMEFHMNSSPIKLGQNRPKQTLNRIM